MPLSPAALVVSWALQLIVAGILGQTLFFKFTGAPESVFIFTTLGVEPWGRYAAGSAELVAVVLLMIPRTSALGAALALAVIGGAVLSHLTKLGIEVQGDRGLLFGLAVTVLVASSVILWIRRGQLPIIGRWLLGDAPALIAA